MSIKNINIGTVEKWDCCELSFGGKTDGNPFSDVNITAVFSCRGIELIVYGFYDGGGVYKVRFMPAIEGVWLYHISSNIPLDGKLRGSFTCVGPSTNHGPVVVSDTWHFKYSDGSRYAPVGTTCYAWIHQPEQLRLQTLDALKSSPFNKMRMCVFPKYYDYNHSEPEQFPYMRDETGNFDFARFNPDFFRLLEDCIMELKSLNVEADLILFHPYDRWGFSNMGSKADDLYLRYITARLSAFSNIWWSLANEYDIMINDNQKKMDDWERFAEIIGACDPYDHLLSIHNCIGFYDHSRPWISHCSIQRQDVYKTSEYTDEWREKYNKPVVIDEVGYEGNINHGWGNIPAQELMRRFWEGAVRGGYVGHGETYMHPEDILWWSKGGKLYGESPARIQFLKDILYDAPPINPIPAANSWDLPCGGVEGEYYLFYFGFNQPVFRTFSMPDGISFKVDIIDTWNMTIDTLPGLYAGNFKIDLPGNQNIAVRMTRDKG